MSAPTLNLDLLLYIDTVSVPHGKQESYKLCLVHSFFLGNCQAWCCVCQYNKQARLLNCSLKHVPSLSSAGDCSTNGRSYPIWGGGLLHEGFRQGRLDNLLREKKGKNQLHGESEEKFKLS